LSYGATTYTYTANGELRTKTDTGGTTTYTYDVRGNLVQVDLPGGDVIQYLVDGQDRRVGKKKNGVLERRWLYRNQLNPVAELDGSGALVARFVYASKSNVPEYVVRGGVTYRVLSDHLGSPRALVDVATGTVAWRANFDAWGKRTLIAGAADFVPFGFAGGMLDHETGLTRFGARDYDPVVGRWVSKDPVRLAGGLNVYSYTASDPTNAIDPTGLEAEQCKDTKCPSPADCDNLYAECGSFCFEYFGASGALWTQCLKCCESKLKSCVGGCKLFYPSSCVKSVSYPAANP
ncbi:MAG: RHS domain-containing protein, partial [Myxococcales bacterium]|nr:RHS domain-containing protein [Myxococcales bacterium]